MSPSEVDSGASTTTEAVLRLADTALIHKGRKGLPLGWPSTPLALQQCPLAESPAFARRRVCEDHPRIKQMTQMGSVAKIRARSASLSRGQLAHGCATPGSA
jgi:hypothetical protein